MMRVMFQLNGKPVEIEVEPRMHLADCLRDELRQTGTHLGCEHGVCGALHGHCRWGRGPILSDARGSGRGIAQWSPSRVSPAMTL